MTTRSSSSPANAAPLWMAALVEALRQGDLIAARDYQDELRKLGLDVRFAIGDKSTPAPGALSASQRDRLDD